MPWQNEMVQIVRHLIDDVDAVTYTETRLETTVLVAAQLTLHDLVFDQTYTVEVDECTLSPDPTLNIKDNSFINIVCLKASCIITGSELKTKAKEAIKIVDGPSTIDTLGATKGLQSLHSELCKTYDKSKLDHQAGVTGQAILTPYSPGSEAIGRRHFSQR